MGVNVAYHSNTLSLYNPSNSGFSVLLMLNRKLTSETYQVNRGSSTDTSGKLALLEVTGDPAHGELKSGFA